MKFLIAGLGSIGRRHLRNLEALGETDIVLYRTHQGTLDNETLAAYPVETDIQAALRHQPGAVIISNPTALHMQVAVPAAKAGCALFIEKPIAHQTDDLLELETTLEQHHNKVFIAYQFRFNSGLQKIKELLDQGTFGRPLSFHCHWGEYLPEWHPWEDYRKSYAARRELGGGVVLTLCHPLDYLRWLFGDVQSLFAYADKVSDLDVDVEDMAEVLLRFRSKVIGSLHLDYYRQPKRHDLEISLSEGSLFWDYASNCVWARKNSAADQEYPAPAGYERNQMYLDEMKHFIQLAAGQAESRCSYQDGKKALQLTWGILQSSRYQQQVIFHENREE